MGLRQTVYVDVLLAVNFFMNYFLMLSAGRILRIALSRTRICLAAAFGAAAALSIFLPHMNLPVSCLYKLAVSAGMVLIAYPWGNWRTFTRNMVVVCAVTFGFGGTMFALWLMVSPRGMVYRNGVIYFNISPLFIVGVTVLCYTVITLAGKIMMRLEMRTKIYDAAVTNEGRTARIRLMCDTGNCLTEPFSGAPVIVVRRGAMTHVLPAYFKEYALSGSAVGAGKTPCHFRVIPYETVAGGGLLTAFRPDKLVIFDGKQSYIPAACYIAISDAFDREDYDGVMNPKLLDG